MSYLKMIKMVCAVLALAGFVILLGTAGASDYAWETGQYYPMADVTKGCVTGILLMLPSLAVSCIGEGRG